MKDKKLKLNSSDCSGASFAEVGIHFLPAYFVLFPARPPPSIPPSFPSVRPEGTLPARDPFSLSLPLSPVLSPTSSVKLRGVKLEPRPIQQVSRRTHTHTLKSSPFAKFSIIRVPPWFVPHHTSPPPLLPCSLLLPLLPPFLLILSSADALSLSLSVTSLSSSLTPLSFVLSSPLSSPSSSSSSSSSLRPDSFYF